MSSWEAVDWDTGQDFFGVFETYDYSPIPCAIFSTREGAEQYIKIKLIETDFSFNSDHYCISICREGHDGKFYTWNSYDEPPEGLADGN